MSFTTKSIFLISLAISFLSFGQKQKAHMPYSNPVDFPQAGNEAPPPFTRLTQPDSLNLLQIDSLVTWARERERLAKKINLSHLPGYEPLPPHKSVKLDTSQYKPLNFRFNSSRETSLTDWIEKGIPLPPTSCKPTWGLFGFRVNASGNVDTTWYDGNLQPYTTTKILENIRSTDGHWEVKTGTLLNQVAWFIYPYFDIRGTFDKASKCSEADQELKRTVWFLSHLVSRLYFSADPNDKRATILKPTTLDGTMSH